MHFKFCPYCGSSLSSKNMGDEGEVPYCLKCKRSFFDMFSTCVIALVVNEFDEAVLLEQKYISEKYKNLISGYMKPGETAEAAAKREVKEEVGLELTDLKPAGTYWFEKNELLMIAFIGKAPKSELKLSEEVDGAQWVKLEKAVNMVHPKGSISNAVIVEYINRPKGDKL